MTLLWNLVGFGSVSGNTWTWAKNSHFFTISVSLLLTLRSSWSLSSDICSLSLSSEIVSPFWSKRRFSSDSCLSSRCWIPSLMAVPWEKNQKKKTQPDISDRDTHAWDFRGWESNHFYIAYHFMTTFLKHFKKSRNPTISVFKPFIMVHPSSFSYGLYLPSGKRFRIQKLHNEQF